MESEKSLYQKLLKTRGDHLEQLGQMNEKIQTSMIECNRRKIDILGSNVAIHLKHRDAPEVQISLSTKILKKQLDC
jgi:hypothetical protein